MRLIIIFFLSVLLCCASAALGDDDGNSSKKAFKAPGSQTLFALAESEQPHQNDLDFFNLSLEEMMQTKVTGSTLTEEPLKKVPSSVTVFTRDEIRRLGMDTLEELMNFVPGYQAYRQDENSYLYSFSSRGRKMGDTAREVLVLIDGHRIYNDWNGGMVTTTPLVPLVNIKRVEFIRGPGSAIYGSNAFLGVVNVVTVKDANEVGLSYGENNMRSGYLMASGKPAELELNAFARYYADDGEDFKVGDTFSNNRITTSDAINGSDLRADCRWKNTGIHFNHTRRAGEDFYVVSTISNDFNTSYHNFSNVSVEQLIEWSPDFESSIDVGYQWHEEKANLQLTPAGYLQPISLPPSTDPLLVKAAINIEELQIALRNNWHLKSDISFQFGMEYRRLELKKADIGNNFDMGDLANGNFPVPYYGDFSNQTPLAELSDRDILGIYGQYQMPILETTHVTLGLRYDSYSGIGSSVSPRLGLVHLLTPAHTVKLLYGEAFRAPTFVELETINNPTLIGNPDLDPETVKTWELVWMSTFKKAMLAASLFHNTFEDSIVQDVSGGSRTYVNGGKEEGWGMEAEFSAQILDNWYFRSTLTHFFEKPDSAFRESETLASLIINYQLRNWNFNLSANFQDEKQMAVGGTDNLITLDSFWVAHAKIQYAFSKRWTAFLKAKNLFDEDYETPPQSAGLSEGIPNRGREASVGITWEF